MLSSGTKKKIADKVQEILQNIEDDELPYDGEISFILHIDGRESWSWANIRNRGDIELPVPHQIAHNLTVKE